MELWETNLTKWPAGRGWASRREAAMTADVFRLGVSLLLAALRLDIRPAVYRNDDWSSVIFRLEGGQTAVDFAVYAGHLLVDDRPLAKLAEGPFALALHCDTPLRLAVNVSTSNQKGVNSTKKYTVIEPTVCSRYNRIVLRLFPDDRPPPSEWFAGCLANATIGDRPLFQSRCRNVASTMESRPVKNMVRSVTEAPEWPTRPDNHVNSDQDDHLIRLGARLRVREGGATPLGFANVYLAPGHRRRWPALGDNYAAVKFDIVTQPEHGRLTSVSKSGHRMAGFTYADLMDGRVEYRHDGSESASDSIDFQVKAEVPSLETRLGWMERQQKVFALGVDVEPVDDAAQLRAGLRGNVLQLAPGGRMRLSDSYLRVWDTDNSARDVWVSVRRADGALVLDEAAHRLTRFSQAQLLAGEIFIASDGGDGSIEFCAGDCTAPDASRLTLRVTSAPLRLRTVANTGVTLPHRATVSIGAQNLSFAVDFEGEAHLPLRYVVVDQPKFGLVECRPRPTDTVGRRPIRSAEIWRSDRDNFQICAQFEQSDVDDWRVRYRHTSDSRPQSDAVGFQTSTPVHVLHVNFIAVRFRVFTRTPVVLNATLEARLSAENLLASAFPANPPPDELLYHIVEPPRYGMLTRRIDGGKSRRIGVSSNFTQAHINDAAVLYRLHYVQYAPLRDHFAYRLITASATSELMRFEIGYLPGPNSLSLVNRTLILAEGAKQTITNSTLWLETPDERDFRFTVVVSPFNGRLALEGTRPLTIGDSFTSSDILAHRLSYEHCGEETTADRWLLAVESANGQQSLRFSFWLAASIVPANDNAPRLRRQPASAENVTTIALVDETERILYPAMLPWLDADSSSGLGPSYSISPPMLSFHVAELFRDFIICTRDSPELSVRNFTSRQLEDRSLIVRHLNLRKSSNKLRYTVSDGMHTVESALRFVASPPFIRLTAGQLALPANFTTDVTTSDANADSNRRFILITSVHLTADTNVDVDPDTIRFERLHTSQPSPFRLTDGTDGTWLPVNSFTQHDIHAGHVFLALAPSAVGSIVPLRISAGDDSEKPKLLSSTFLSGFTSLFRSSNSRQSTKSKTESSLTRLSADVMFSVQPSADHSLTSQTLLITSRSDDHSNQERGAAVFDCVVESSTVVDARSFAVATLRPTAVGQIVDAKFFIVRPPRYGILTLDAFRNDSDVKDIPVSPTPSSHPVDGFRQSDVNAGRLRYVNVNASADHDDFVVLVSVPPTAFAEDGNEKTIVGPWRIDVNLIDLSRPHLIPSRQLSVRPGVDLTLRPTDLRLAGAAFDVGSTPSLEYRIMRAPTAGAGHLALRLAQSAPAPIQSAFRHSDLEDGRVVISTTSGNLEGALEWELRVCTSAIRQAKCSANAKLHVTVDLGNEYGPSIVRNEPLTVADGDVALTAAYLSATDADTPPAGLRYLIWQVDGGSLRRRSGPGPTDETDIISFSQADIDDDRILFVRESADSYTRDDQNPDPPAGFQFFVTDGRHQTLPAVFRILTREPSQLSSPDDGLPIASIPATSPKHSASEPAVVVLMAVNARLNVAPGVRQLITNATLRAAAVDVRPDDLVYRIRRPPLHSRLSVDGHGEGGPTTDFTQADVDGGLLACVAPADPGAWSQRDAFEFTVEARGRVTAAAETVYTYRIHSSFAHALPADLPALLSREDVVISYGGSVMLNASHLNLTRLAALSDDVLLLSVERLPPCGRLTRLRDAFDPNSATNQDEDVDLDLPREHAESSGYDNSESLRAFRADELTSGREIVYRHIGSDCENDAYRNVVGSDSQIVLRIFALREKTVVTDGLRVELRVRQTPSDGRETIARFPDQLDIVAGGRVTLDATKFLATAIDASDVVYRLAQLAADGLRLVQVGGDEARTPITSFTQDDVNRGAIAVQHVFDDDDGGDGPSTSELGALVFRIGEADARRVLAVRVEPPAVRLVNLTDIGLAQGRTYVVLNRHLGAVRNGSPDDAHRLIYNVTRPPANGSLYWVAGDTQARAFTQKNLNDGEILYAQLNMNAYQDSFGFVLSDGAAQTAEREAHVVVVAPLTPLRPFVTRTRTITQITAVHLNVTPIMTLSPRFFVVGTPKFGQFWLHAETNASATFFTGADVAEGNLFFHAFRVSRREMDEVELELVLDDAQPARLLWPIDVRPFEKEAVGKASAEFAFNSVLQSQHPIDNGLVPPTGSPAAVRPSDVDYRFPVLILLGMVGFIVALAVCQWRNASAAASEAKEKERRRSSARTVSLSGLGVTGNGSDSSEGSGRAIPGLGPPRPLPDVDDMVMPAITVPAMAAKAPPRGILTTSSSVPAASTFAPNTAAGNSSDLLKSTVYATIGSPNGAAHFEGQRRAKLAKSVTLADDFVEDRERAATSSSRENDSRAVGNRNAPFTAAVRSMAASSPRRRTLATVKEDCTAVEPLPGDFDTFGHGFYEASRGGRRSVEVAPLVAVNPTAAAARRFLLPSRKPVAVTAIVPPFDEEPDDVTTYVKLPSASTFRDGISDGAPMGVGSILSPSPTIADGGVQTLRRRPTAGPTDDFDSSFKSNEYWV